MPMRPPSTAKAPTLVDDEDTSPATVVAPGSDAPLHQTASAKRAILPVLRRLVTRASELPTNLGKSVVGLNPSKAGFLLPVLAGLVFWLTPLGRGLEMLSYDLQFLFRPTVHPQEAVIIYMDEKSFRELGQDPSHWYRSLHAHLLDYLTRDNARAVVFDVVFADAGDPAANAELKQAIQRNGRIVLAASLQRDPRPGLSHLSVVKPLDEFLQAAAGWGIAEVNGERDGMVRRYFPNSDFGDNLPTAAATVAGEKLSSTRLASAWLNYYGPQGTIKSVSYCEVTNQLPGYFRDKAVFVGARPKALYAFQESEDFRVPYSKWGGSGFPGVDLAATSFLNLQRNETLTRLHPVVEVLLLVCCGLLLGWGATALRPALAGAGAAGVALAAFSAGLALPWVMHTWLDWMVVVAVQVPTALAWKAVLVIKASRAKPDFSPFFATDGKQRIPNIPDHTLLARIGAGAYGEVWLARDTIGLYRAVKFVFRDRYSSPDPFRREFHGLQKYAPISLNHPALVHVLHIGKNDPGGYFFYIMEAGDDEAFGPQIQEGTYAAKNLSRELLRRKRLLLPECLDLGLHLTTALEYLHSAGLIHRDIKPSNIIYVKRIPKLADIGLVTEITTGNKGATYVGTEGYIPPEGPGTPEGDIYSLGKVLYEAGMGRDRMKYPDLPTSLVEGTGDPGLLRFNEIILRACEADPKRRYRSAAQLKEDLSSLRDQILGASTR
jgi:CHASE2 domain-containing sensor protein